MKGQLLGLFLMMFILGGNVSAQDIHFSQFYMSPLNLNPAMTGVMNCNVRMIANFRNQWASVTSNPYNTFSASYDQKMTIGRSDYFGIGGTLFGDVAGESRFATLAGTLSGSYSKLIGGNRNSSHYLVLGASAGVRQRSIKDLAALRFGDQYNRGGDPFPVSVESGVPGFNNNYLFADVNGGLMYFAVFNKSNSVWLGAAMNHINKPNQAFYDGEFFELSSRYTVHGGAEIEISNQFDVLPGFVYLKQSQAFELNVGTSVRKVLSKTNYEYQAVQLGVWVRMANSVQSSFITDALIFSTRFDYDQFGIGFSYDVNLSELRTASNGNGAFEFALIYNICGQERRNEYCPKF